MANQTWMVALIFIVILLVMGGSGAYAKYAGGRKKKT